MKYYSHSSCYYKSSLYTIKSNTRPAKLHAKLPTMYLGYTYKMLSISVLFCRGVSGDLYIFVRVNEKQGIHREGLHLYSDVTIDYTDAILGTTVKVSC